MRRNACLRLVCDIYFYVNSCRRDGADKINVISQKSVMNLELVYDASATPFGCCRRHDCDVTALYVNQPLRRDSSVRYLCSDQRRHQDFFSKLVKMFESR